MTKSLKISLIISILFLGIIRLRPIWERNPGGLWTNLYFLAMIVLFFWIAIKIVIEIKRIVKQRKDLKIKVLMPIIVLIIFLIDGIFNPFKIDLDYIYGEVNFRACYEGTMNTAKFILRENNDFELHWTGAFGYDKFYLGKYEKQGDTLLLTYEGDKPVRFGEKILMDNENELLITIRDDNDSLQNVATFYYGYCKGLN